MTYYIGNVHTSECVVVVRLFFCVSMLQIYKIHTLLRNLIKVYKKNIFKNQCLKIYKLIHGPKVTAKQTKRKCTLRYSL